MGSGSRKQLMAGRKGSKKLGKGGKKLNG